MNREPEALSPGVALTEPIAWRGFFFSWVLAGFRVPAVSRRRSFSTFPELTNPECWPEEVLRGVLWDTVEGAAPRMLPFFGALRLLPPLFELEPAEPGRPLLPAITGSRRPQSRGWLGQGSFP